MSTTLPAVGARVEYRFWPSNPWLSGVIDHYWVGVCGTVYADITRDGFYETAVLPAAKVVDPELVREVTA